MNIDISIIDLSALQRIGRNINTQDNRSTADPMFCVYQKKEIFGIDDNFHDCSYIYKYDDHILYEEDDGYEFLETNDGFDDEGNQYEKIGFIEIDDFVQGFFTEEGAKHYIKHNKHNLRKPFIYTIGMYRNFEMIFLRDFIAKIAR